MMMFWKTNFNKILEDFIESKDFAQVIRKLFKADYKIFWQIMI
jgi:hypothetical protein